MKKVIWVRSIIHNITNTFMSAPYEKLTGLSLKVSGVRRMPRATREVISDVVSHLADMYNFPVAAAHREIGIYPGGEAMQLFEFSKEGRETVTRSYEPSYCGAAEDAVVAAANRRRPRLPQKIVDDIIETALKEQAVEEGLDEYALLNEYALLDMPITVQASVEDASSENKEAASESSDSNWDNLSFVELCKLCETQIIEHGKVDEKLSTAYAAKRAGLMDTLVKGEAKLDCPGRWTRELNQQQEPFAARFTPPTATDIRGGESRNWGEIRK